jgi:RNA polymerase sigma factor (sigma-70 family)
MPTKEPRMSLNCILRTQSDARLVDLARCGHDAAFDEIVRRYRGALLRHCRGILSDALAEDATQQAFVDAWAALRREGGEVRSLKPWLYQVAHHAALRQISRAARLELPLDDWHSSEEAVGDDMESRLASTDALNAIAGLPARQMKRSS